jgi:hypothetical protein
MTILVVILLLVTLGALPPGPTAEAGTTTPRRLWARCTILVILLLLGRI